MSLRLTEICYPEVLSYYIVWNNKKVIVAWGILETYQCLETKWDNVDLYTKEIDWLNILIDNGINPFPEV
tara:strand:- start:314 stop:523 length:210 start_codon:yes stop_codon:yes gene_type:complete